MTRFRPVPAQYSLPWVLDYIAGASIREVIDGWTWKFDGRIFDGEATDPAILSDMHCPLVFFAGENGLVSPGMQRTIDAAPGITYVQIPDAGHAPMLDQPLALLTGIRTALAGWLH